MKLKELNDGSSRLKKYIEKIENNKDWGITKEEEEYINSGMHSLKKRENKEFLFEVIPLLLGSTIVIDGLTYFLSNPTYESLPLLMKLCFLTLNALAFGACVFYIFNSFMLKRVEKKLSKGNKKLFRTNFILEKKELEFHYKIIKKYLDENEIAKIMSKENLNIIGKYETINYLYFKAKEKVKYNLDNVFKNETKVKEQLKLLHKNEEIENFNKINF